MVKIRSDSVLSEIIVKRLQTTREIKVENLPERKRRYHSLKQAIKCHNFPALILECKAASPTKGQLASNYDPVKLARIYQRYGATGISVLVESDYFNGHYSHLQTVAKSIDLPVLCKDFIITRAQIAAAHAYGADAVLLMLQVLEDEEYRDLASYATQMHLEVLTEVSNQAECERANQLGADLIDINHRDLHSLEIDLERCRNLRPYLSDDAVVVAASGIRHRAELEKIADSCDAYLIGSSLSGSNILDSAIKLLIYGNLKVCGISDAEIAKHAARCGASYGGLIWHSASPRHVDILTSAQIIADSENKLRFLMVTREYDLQILQELAAAAKAIGFWGIQLHAPMQVDEVDFINQVRQLIDPNLKLIRAVSGEDDWKQIQALVAHPDVTWVIVDSPSPGSGQIWDWQQIPTDLRQKIWVAGGLGLGSIAAAKEAGFAGYDINSGVERIGAAGPVKDPHLIEKLFNKIRTYIPENRYGN